MFIIELYFIFIAYTTFCMSPVMLCHTLHAMTGLPAIATPTSGALRTLQSLLLYSSLYIDKDQLADYVTDKMAVLS